MREMAEKMTLLKKSGLFLIIFSTIIYTIFQNIVFAASEDCYQMIEWVEADYPDSSYFEGTEQALVVTGRENNTYIRYYVKTDTASERILEVNIQSFRTEELAQERWNELNEPTSWEREITTESDYTSMVTFDPDPDEGHMSIEVDVFFKDYTVFTITAPYPNHCHNMSTSCEPEPSFANIYAEYWSYALEAMDIIDSKCGDVASNTAPQISILPDPHSEIFAFQQNIVDGTGFTLFVEDADGLGDLDFSTFKVFIAGVDNTAHFLDTVSAMADRVETQTTDTTIAFFIRPDPSLFMSDHNVFNIQWNGDWPVSLEICDTSGECHTATYSIYFGPFLTIDEVVDPNCVQASDSSFRNLTLNDFVIGNCGFFSPAAVMYIGIKNSEGELWTYSEDSGYIILSRELLPFYTLMMEAGLFLPGSQVDLPVVWYSSSEDNEYSIILPAGTYQMMSTVIDLAINPAFLNDIRIYSREVFLCE